MPHPQTEAALELEQEKGKKETLIKDCEIMLNYLRTIDPTPVSQPLIYKVEMSIYTARS